MMGGKSNWYATVPTLSSISKGQYNKNGFIERLTYVVIGNKKYHFNFMPTFLRNVAYMLPRPMSVWSITSKEANVGICTL